MDENKATSSCCEEKKKQEGKPSQTQPTQGTCCHGSGGSDKGSLEDLKIRFWTALLFTVPLLLFAMGDMIPGVHLSGWPTPELNLWLQGILATPVVCWAGALFFEWGWESIKTRKYNMFTLISVGTGAAYGFSLIALVFPDFLPEAFKAEGRVNVYFESAAVIITLVLLGQVLETKAHQRTGAALKALMDQAPKSATLVSPCCDKIIPLEDVHVGNILRVHPGKNVPVDGVIIEGSSQINESMVTGESMPVTKHPGDKVTGGTINGQSSFTMRAEKVGDETLLSQIIHMVESAQASRAPIQKLADTFAQYFVPVVFGVALATLIIWAFWGAEPKLSHALINAVAVLIIACPCALGLATPVSIMVGVGRGALSGILIKDAESFQQLENITTIVVDKTGTLTEGSPTVTDVFPKEGFSVEELLQYGASIEHHSEHPIAQAIWKRAEEAGVRIWKSENVTAVTGSGIIGTIEESTIRAGNLEFMKVNECVVDSTLESKAKHIFQEAKTLVFIAKDKECIGFFGIADPIKATTPQAIEHLHKLGLKIVMITGDNEATAKAVAEKLGIDSYQANAKPDAKFEAVKALQAKGEKVAMAGDGMNDAPALAQANVGIAMSTGTDVAIESASITLLKGDLRGIEKAIRLSRATLRNIRQNLFFAFFYNGLGIPIAAGILYPFFGILLSPMIASAAMSLSSISVIGNALRLKRTRI